MNNPSCLTQLLTVSFYDDDLTIINHNGEPYVPMKPIVENMGLRWQPQLAKLNENPKRWGITKIVIPTKGGLQSMVCVPMRKLFGWLSTISPKKVAPNIKDKIIQYQNECDDVLWHYWSQKNRCFQDELNQLYQLEAISQAKGSFHGRGLNKRKQEKPFLQAAINALSDKIQLKLAI